MLRIRGLKPSMNAKLWSDMQHVTCELKDYRRDPSLHIVTHMECLKQRKPGGKNNTINGQYFEACVLDAILHIVPAGNIGRHIDVLPSKKTEIDIVIMGKRVFGIHCKCSARERWAQADRTAILDRQRRDTIVDEHVLIIFGECTYPAEKDKKPIYLGSPFFEKCLRREVRAASNKQGYCEGVTTVLCAYDVEGMKRLFGRVKDACNKPYRR